MKRSHNTQRGIGLRAIAILALVLTWATATGTAQEGRQPGRIVGTIVSDQGIPVAHAMVEVTIGDQVIRTTTGADGSYTLMNVPAGSVTLSVRGIGFAPKLIEGIKVPSGGVVGQDVLMVAEALELEEITVFAEQETGSIASTIDEQRYAQNIINQIGQEDITRNPDSDAAQSMQRVTGVTVQDDKFVQVRGLGARYTTTSLNGSRIPSPEPEKRVVPLDLYSASMLEAVTTSKTFTPDQAGDFAGAAVNIKTREFRLGRVIDFGVEMGFNNMVTGQDLLRAPNEGQEWLGYGGSVRAIPTDLASAGNLGGSSQTDVNGYIASFRDSWWSQPTTGFGEGKVALNIGGEDPAFGRLFSYFVSGIYKAEQTVRADEQRALATGGGPINEYSGESQTNSVLWGGVVNLSTRLGAGGKLSWENTYNRSGDNSATVLSGVNEEFSGQGDLQFTRLSFVERSVFQTQLAGNHLLGSRHVLDWRGAFSTTSRDEPDRSDVIYQANVDPNSGAAIPTAWADIRQSATRTWSNIKESIGSGSVDFRYGLGDPTRPSALKVGGAFRYTDRNAPAAAYDIRNLTLSPAERQQVPETLFGDANALAGRFTLQANALAGSYYANEAVGAGYAMVELPLGDRFEFIGGTRVEYWDLEVESTSITGQTVISNPTTTDVLPALALTWHLNEYQNLRFSATQTVSRPEYREVSPVSSVEILGDRNIVGNPDLGRALIQNYDARWEWYPRSGEVISLGAFAKNFDDPIEPVLVATTGAPLLTYVNADGAFNYGIEVEFRKRLDFVSRSFRDFSLLMNATLMQSEIQLGTDSLSALTNPDRPMVGQAPYVLNSGLLYASPGGQWTANLLLNVVGRRIVEAGQQPLPDAYEEPQPVLDFAFRAPLGETARFKLKINNILDSKFQITQGDVTRLSYLSGRKVSFGFGWSL